MNVLQDLEQRLDRSVPPSEPHQLEADWVAAAGMACVE